MKGQAKQALKQSKSKSPVLKRAMKGKMTGTDQANLSKATYDSRATIPKTWGN